LLRLRKRSCGPRGSPFRVDARRRCARSCSIRSPDLGCGRRLSFYARQCPVKASPTWRAGCPDRHRRTGNIGIIEGSNPNEDEMRSCLRLAKERSAAIGAKPSVHSIAAIRHAREVARLPFDLERGGAKASTHRSASRAQVLAIAAPAHPRGDGRLSAFPTNRTAKATACHCHCVLPRQSDGRMSKCMTSSRCPNLV
jgi:hypothetical protein